ncbi:MAG: hypothetical protein K0S24_1830 [Sphingobacterium sp.]|jgi:threonine/homoserine/homoserine lactone efflux protein|nr:hypothetical protein [Sphingobacterium sp.]
MKRIIFKFWLTNILISIALFVIYRIVIAETNHNDGNFFEMVLQILDISLNLVYSFVYLIGMVICSCALFLNLIDKIRNNIYLSLLTFVGIPLFCAIFITINMLSDSILYNETVTLFRNLVIFSIIYLFFSTFEFLLFRKRIKNLRSE